MTEFGNNSRLQDNINYSLDWAIYLRHNITDQLIPFLFEWEGDQLFMNMLQPGGDPEEFAYRIAEKSERDSDQFVIGYEGILTDENGNKKDAFIIKGYDKTQSKGMFIAQMFNSKEKNGIFEIIDRPMLIGNPDLPFAVNSNLKPNYIGEELYASGMVVNKTDQIAILSHFNPSVVATGVKSFLRSILQSENSSSLSGKLEISIAPQDTFNAFFKYTIIRVIKEELFSPYAIGWKLKNGKQIKLVCKHGDDIIYQNFEDGQKEKEEDKQNTSISKEKNEHQSLIEIYQSLSKSGLDSEFKKVVSIPNASTNIDCLNKVTALMEVYESKGIEVPGSKLKKAKKPSTGCLSVFLIGIAITIGFLMI